MISQLRSVLGGLNVFGPRDVVKEAVLLSDVEQPFSIRYEQGIETTGTPDRGSRRRARFYNLMGLLQQTQGLEGCVAECGCWKGLSSFLTCHAMRDADPGFRGENYFVFDSFEGLSEPTSADRIEKSVILKGRDRRGAALKPAGAYAATLEDVKRVLSEFPDVTFIKGWIPQSLSDLPDRKYRFVHIDLDLYIPTKGAAEYFLPRMVTGGLVVCDDYGSLFWPGAKQGFDEAAEMHGLRVLSLSSGQGVLIKR